MNFSTIKKAALVLAASTSLTACMGLGPALVSSNSTSIAGVFEVSAPYTSYTSYFGYIERGAKPQGTHKGKGAYYLYVWVPAVIDEIGVSMVSPATNTPSESDYQSVKFTELGEANPDKFFDTYIALDRLAIIDNLKIKDGGKSLITLTQNDDSHELEANPRGVHYNSLLRHVSVVSNPMKALTRGVYRIAYASFRGSVEGSFEATVGTNIPGVKIAPTLEQLHELVNAPEEAAPAE